MRVVVLNARVRVYSISAERLRLIVSVRFSWLSSTYSCAPCITRSSWPCNGGSVNDIKPSDILKILIYCCPRCIKITTYHASYYSRLAVVLVRSREECVWAATAPGRLLSHFELCNIGEVLDDTLYSVQYTMYTCTV